MSNFDNRSEPRKKACVQAFASDLDDSFDVKCIIRDVSKSGCMIVTSHVHELPDLIQLVPECFDQPLNGKIVWRKDKRAGISFLSPTSDEIFTSLKQSFFNQLKNIDEDEPMLLEASVRPLGYADRLARYNPR